MGFQSRTFLCFLCFISLPSLILSQQSYEGNVISDCPNVDNSTSILGYFCNGQSKTCQTYLTFHSQPPYQSVSSISSLLGSDPSQLSQVNSVSQDAIFPTNTKVIVPVNCSCSGGYYQANSSYLVHHDETYFIIANNTYQGLSTCQSLQNQNTNSSSSMYLFSGISITVPLRCACPSSNQTSNGVKYLLSYLVDSEDTVFAISQQIGVNPQSVLDANGLSLAKANIYPFTTLLIPLKNQPNSSQFTTPAPPPSPPTSPPAENSSNSKWVYVGIAIAVVVFALIASLVYFKAKTNKADQISSVDDSGMYTKPGKKSSGVSEDLEVSDHIRSGMSSIGQALKVYNFEELQLATEDFSHECRIEGSVYRGVFNGDVAAVKMMNIDVSQEIDILKKINHFNLIRLSGVCFNQGQWYLVYEYAQNGSLSSWICDRSGSKVLSWNQRVQIALDVANGLNYLHRYTEPPYVHRNVKSSNVLLDGKFRAKVANFGLARPAEGKEGEFVLTRHIVGTKGYLAPEYLEHGLVSPNLDVYAFGVVMMEMMTGKEAVDAQRGASVLLEALNDELTEEDAREKLEGFIDPLLEQNYPLALALIMARLIEGCLRRDAENRPSMGEILQSLSNIFGGSLSWALANSVPESPNFST